MDILGERMEHHLHEDMGRNFPKAAGACVHTLTVDQRTATLASAIGTPVYVSTLIRTTKGSPGLIVLRSGFTVSTAERVKKLMPHGRPSLTLNVDVLHPFQEWNNTRIPQKVAQNIVLT